jgi:hypothetical protein
MRFTSAVVGLGSAIALAAPGLLAQASERAKVTPLFEVFGTYSRPPLADAVTAAYAPYGGVNPGGGLGVAAGVLLYSRIEIAGFYEGATSSLRGSALTNGSRRNFGRTAIGLRIEVPVARLANDFHLLVSGSAFHQELERVTVPAGGSVPGTIGLAQRAFGGRMEAGIEHRGFIGTTWYVTGGVTIAGEGTGWQRPDATPPLAVDSGNGIGVAPIITVGLRTRGW